LNTFIQNTLDSDPGNRNDNVHALLLGALPLVAECAVLLVVPVGADGAVHAAAAVLLWFRGRANVLDHSAVDNVLVGWLRLFVSAGGGFLDQALEDGVLRGVSRVLAVTRME
jgi:hypothetical protein